MKEYSEDEQKDKIQWTLTSLHFYLKFQKLTVINIKKIFTKKCTRKCDKENVVLLL